MVSPFLNILGPPQVVGPGTSETVQKGVPIVDSIHSESTVAFAEVLGGTQNVQQDDGNALPLSLDDGNALPLSLEGENLLPETVAENLKVLDQLTFQGVNLNEPSERPPTQLSPPGSTNREQFQDPFTLVQRLRHGAGIVQVGGGEQARVGESQSSIDQVNILGAKVGQPEHRAQAEVSRVATVASSTLPTIPLLSRPNPETGVGAQPVISQELRVRPLLHENSRSVVVAFPPSVSRPAPPVEQDVNVQRLFSVLEGTGKHAKTDAGSLSLSNVLPSAREEVTVGLVRAEGDGKSVGNIGSVHSGETSFHTSGGGLPFGNHTGNGQGPLHDSSPGIVVSANQGQAVAKAGTFDERLQLLNTSVSQRLQIDVQLSEAARVQVDVGVQQRQVYAGVLLDNPVLRALASQNVQDLASQLGQADMELEEFDVHEENDGLSEQASNDNHWGSNSSGELVNTLENSSSHQEQEVPRTMIKQERGWHLVA